MVASLANLRTFPFIRSRCERGALSLYGAYFDVATGELAALDAASGRFISVVTTAGRPSIGQDVAGR
jgi:carbonic anhydrase